VSTTRGLAVEVSSFCHWFADHISSHLLWKGSRRACWGSCLWWQQCTTCQCWRWQLASLGLEQRP
jgi:hypothetical protein